MAVAATSCDDENTSPADSQAGADLAVDSKAIVDSTMDHLADLPPEAGSDSGGDGQALDATTLTFMAGAAWEDITPAVSAGVPLAGYGAVPRRLINVGTIAARVAAALGACFDPSPGTVASLFNPATGKHDPLTARALVISNGKTKAAIIKVDTIGVSRAFRDDVEKEALALGIPRPHLVLSATHTHGGPGAVSKQKMWELIAADCYHDKTYKTMLAGVIKALKAAHANLKPAKIGFGSAQEKGVTKNRMDLPGVIDPELGLIKVVDATTAKPIAAVINFAIHGTCLGASNMLFTADVMGYTENALEKKLGGGVAIFTNGTEGDVAPNQGGWTGAQSIGSTLADTTSKLWATVSTKPWISIEGHFTDVQMPAPSFNGCLQLPGSKTTLCDILPGVSIPIGLFMQSKLPFAALRLDNVVFAALPGEGITYIGQQVKAAGKALGFTHTFVIGLANDYMGYVVTPGEFNNGGYEAMATMFGKNTGTIVVDSLKAEMKAVVPTSP